MTEHDAARKKDIVERLRDAWDEAAVCHCGNGPKGGCDNHDFAWMEDDYTRILSDARWEIERLRAQLDRYPKTADGARVWPAETVFGPDGSELQVDLWAFEWATSEIIVMGQTIRKRGPTGKAYGVGQCYTERASAQAQQSKEQ